MKKWLLIGIGGVVGIFGIIAVMSFMGVRANDGALEGLRSNDKVVVLKVSGMT